MIFLDDSKQNHLELKREREYQRAIFPTAGARPTSTIISGLRCPSWGRCSDVPSWRRCFSWQSMLHPQGNNFKQIRNYDVCVGCLYLFYFIGDVDGKMRSSCEEARINFTIFTTLEVILQAVRVEVSCQGRERKNNWMMDDAFTCWCWWLWSPMKLFGCVQPV